MGHSQLLAIVVALVGVACTAGDGGGASGPQPTPTATPRGVACIALAESVCARVETCAPFLAKTGTGVGAVCTAAVFDHCFRTAGLGGSNRTVADIASCADAVRKSDCAGFLSSLPDVCEYPPGSLVDGSFCAFHEQCASRFCDRAPDTACGVCAAPPRVGQPCLHDACAPGLVCTSANSCVRPGALGDSCGPNEPCGRLLFCNGDRCAVRRQPGEGCNGFGQCDAFAETTCAANSVCRATATAALGEPCDLTANALTLCNAPARCIDDRCAPAKAEGASCGSAGSHECDGFQSECIRGRCLLRTVEMCQL